ncbi:MAG: hypothetical protein Q4G43_04285 [Mobilicoccus sp.]|nr:hypothetical protein [Mobilicoccus sp.]
MSADAASCAVLAADLQAGAARLMAASGDSDEARRVAGAMAHLGSALAVFAQQSHSGAVAGPGLPSPHTALRMAAQDVHDRLGRDT